MIFIAKSNSAFDDDLLTYSPLQVSERVSIKLPAVSAGIDIPPRSREPFSVRGCPMETPRGPEQLRTELLKLYMRSLAQFQIGNRV